MDVDAGGSAAGGAAAAARAHAQAADPSSEDDSEPEYDVEEILAVRVPSVVRRTVSNAAQAPPLRRTMAVDRARQCF
jgi:hypothetical protein